MKKKSFAQFSLLILLLLTTSCSGAAKPEWIESAGLYQEPEGLNPTVSYGWLDTFYLVVKMADIQQDTVVQASWIAVDTNRLEPNTVIKIDKKEALSTVIVFELENEGNFWPVGDYQVNIYLDGKLIQEIGFEVYHTDIS